MPRQDVKVRARGGYSLLYSVTPDRADPQPLDGAVLGANVHVFVTPTDGVGSVLFHYEDADQRTDSSAPFDLVGNSGADALVLDVLSTFGVGEHTITAAVVAGSNVYHLSASFSVVGNAMTLTAETYRAVVPAPTIVITASTNASVTPAAVARSAAVPAPTVTAGSSSSFAGPGTVGYGIGGRTSSLTTFSGDKTMAAGESISDRNITGMLTLANNSTVTNCWVRKYAYSVTGSTVTYSTIGPNFNPESAGYTNTEMQRSVCFGATTYQWCDIRGLVDGLFLGNNAAGILMEDCWVHGSFKRASDPDQGGGASHCDCVQIGRGDGHTFRRCRFDMIPWESGETFDQWNNGAWPLPSSAFRQSGQPTGTQGIIIRPVATSNTISNIVFDSCRFSGYTAGHLIYLGINGTAKPTNVSFTNCQFDVRGINTARKLLGIDSGVANPTWTGNTLAAAFTAPSGNVYAQGASISLTLAKTVLTSW